MRPTAIVVLALTAIPAAAQDMPLNQILVPGEGWTRIHYDFHSISSLKGDGRGNVFVADSGRKQIVKIGPDGKPVVFATTKLPAVALAVWPDGQVCACLQEGGNGFVRNERERQASRGELVLFDKAGKKNSVTPCPALLDMVAAKSGRLFCVPMVVPHSPNGLILFQAIDGDRKVLGERRMLPGQELSAGVALWSDGATLAVADDNALSIRAYRVEPDGSLAHPEFYYRPYVRRAGALAARGLTVDSAGRLYAATSEGVQVFDPTGRLCGVLAKPSGPPVCGVAFGGRDLDQLYTAFGQDKLYVRKLNTKGVAPPGAK